MSASRFVVLALALGGVVFPSCTTTTESSGVASLAVTPDPVFLVRHDSIQLAVSALDADDHLVTGVSVTFTSSDTAIVTVSNLGWVRSTGPAGLATITVRGGGVTKVVPVTVTQVPVAVVLTPSDTSIAQGGSVQYRAKVVDGNGDSIPGPSITFGSSDSTLVTISGSGLARSIGGAGLVFITARNGPRADFATLTVRDTSIIARLPLDGSPYGITVLPNGIAYITRVFADTVQRLNMATPAFTAGIAVGSAPSAIASNPAGTNAYVANQFSGNVGIIDVATATQTGVIPVNGDPVVVAVSADNSTLFETGNNVNRLYKIAIGSGTVVDSLDLPATSHHLLIHPNDTLLYVATRDGGSVLEVNWRTLTVARTFTLGGRTQGLVLSPDNQELYVADETGSVLRVVNLTTGAIAATVTLAGGGHHVALSADGTRLYVGLVFDGKVQVINRTTRAIIKTIVTGGAPRQIGVDAARSRMVVVNQGGWVDILR